MQHGGAAFAHPHYTIRTQFFRLFGGAYRIQAPDGALALYSDMKRFRLREDIRFYSDESKQHEVLRISTQSILDISGAYDVHDSASGECVGSLRRAGISSTFLRDRWTIHDAGGAEIGEIVEDSTARALVRRIVDAAAFLMPQRHHASVGGRTVAVYAQRFNPVIFKLDVDLSSDPGEAFDRRLALAAGVLLSAVEGRQ